MSRPVVDLGHGFRVESHAEVGSTNDLLRERANAGEPEGLVVRADVQTRGRGRFGRDWSSPRGNLYASILLRPACTLAEAATLSLVVSLAVAEALDPVVGEPSRLRLKWPNDVLLDGRKLAGILLEGADDGRGAVAWIVVGCGLNLAWRPPELDQAVSLVEATGRALEPTAFLERLVPVLTSRLEAWRRHGFAGLREAWLGRALGLGSEVTLRVGATQVRGRLVDLGADGSIRIETAEGRTEHYTAGELFFS